VFSAATLFVAGDVVRACQPEDEKLILCQQRFRELSACGAGLFTAAAVGGLSPAPTAWVRLLAGLSIAIVLAIPLLNGATRARAAQGGAPWGRAQLASGVLAGHLVFATVVVLAIVMVQDHHGSIAFEIVLAGSLVALLVRWAARYE
jgi:hypothetical protein